jgi:hypothetical protein
MKTILNIAIICIVIFAVNPKGNAQVTIGSDFPPVEAALLDLKDRVSGSDTVSSNSGGLLLPRVELKSQYTLEPFIEQTDAEWQTSNRPQTRKDHVGLSVYNLTNNSDFHPGIYVWMGAEWRPLEIASNYIYVPSFNLPWKESQVDLFKVYQDNLNFATNTRYKSSNNNIRVVFPEFNDNASDFYYVVTYYDPQVLSISGISENGVMSYTRNPSLAVPPEGSFINIVMIRK